ncbi:SGNH/GDSL hydrolase family protein [Microbacterium azadirachtae]|uniref:SGNH/GDSL hydrolase family protein n=1 Tax=Microbacterium azadirachtae TaxID=582680 RepID=UPI000889290A|nr:SGNH/GDSL hydrolase family protein [Microbacterium azadirachtae]SDL13230.1 GDSL-like Lipase/Acylhydrolase family protein [Microbacterium azadirachtae]SEF43144.1 GDSL-like Lipase/Acylhydrolase family protein [Microbacterium azadirachtae]SEF43195.1 GDSL-like Lipase/Acylhydrolase family protein [Microbacterium azadirachtae]
MTTSDHGTSDHGTVVSLPNGSVRVEGHLDLVTTADGVRPVRIPVRHWTHFPPAGEVLRAMASNASGVRLRVETEATRLTLRVRCTRIRIGEAVRPGDAFVARVDGVDVAVAAAPDTQTLAISPAGDEAALVSHAGDSLIELAPLPAGRKVVTVFLPQGMTVDLLDIVGDADVTAAPPSGRPVWVHHGSSISHGAEAELPTSVWPVVASELAELDVVNLGFGGHCMLDPFVADAIAAAPADLISLKVGVNIVGARAMDQRTFVPALHGFIDRIRAGHPDTPLVLCSSILWPGSDDTPGPSDVEFFDDGGIRCFTAGDPADIGKGALTLAESRRHIEHVVEVRRAAGENISYLDGLALYGPGDVERHPLPDSLHPDTALYEEIGRRFAQRVFGDEGLYPRAAIVRTA